ncbi:MAG: hypothetical protein COX57_05865 [Alphaproteobacteria bacterium CG_4_10_14_0_2_um_filter_63_37]|nr:MAG: hypothetical protein COX57_05865 [Alphaproteobacteria bacterium CG_4_10_14_0_2_um_filter_63_37]
MILKPIFLIESGPVLETIQKCIERRDKAMSAVAEFIARFGAEDCAAVSHKNDANSLVVTGLIFPQGLENKPGWVRSAVDPSVWIPDKISIGGRGIDAEMRSLAIPGFSAAIKAAGAKELLVSNGIATAPAVIPVESGESIIWFMTIPVDSGGKFPVVPKGMREIPVAEFLALSAATDSESVG